MAYKDPEHGRVRDLERYRRSTAERLAAILARRRANSDAIPADLRDWVFPSQSSASGHVEELHAHYTRITKAGTAESRCVSNYRGSKG